jgi:hypothetical protein
MGCQTNYSQIRILTPNDVAKLMPFVSESWIYDHWEDFGGVTIGRRKFILWEVFYANLQGGQMVVRTDNGGQGEMDAEKSQYGKETVENKKGSKTRRSGTEGACREVKNHSNKFGLVDAVQSVS